MFLFFAVLLFVHHVCSCVSCLLQRNKTVFLKGTGIASKTFFVGVFVIPASQLGAACSMAYIGAFLTHQKFRMSVEFSRITYLQDNVFTSLQMLGNL